jgi:hypothetical protein
MIDEGELMTALRGNAFWEAYLPSVFLSGAARVHLAVLVEPYLSYIMDGSKTVESRFSRVAVAPYQKVDAGDVLLLKRAGGEVEAICCAVDAWFYELGSSSLSEIRHRFGDAMRVSAEFLASRSDAVYATLIRIEEVYPIVPLRARKRDRRGWVVLIDPTDAKSALPLQQLSLDM